MFTGGQTRLAWPRRRWLGVGGAAVVWIAAITAAALLLAGSHASTRHSILVRLEQRIQGGAEFASLYVRDLFDRERVQAGQWLSAHKISYRDLVLASGGVGAPAAVLLDARGDALQILPRKPGLIGQDLASRYAHLRAAVTGHQAVSNVVPSAARGLPVAALALPFHSAAGQRVFSAAFPVSRTPLGAYMSRLLVLPGRRVYMIDATGHLIASTQPIAAGAALDNSDRHLARLVASGHRVGTSSSSRGEETFVVARVAGTPWNIVASEPTAQLYGSIDTGGQSLAWFALAGLAIAGLVIIVIGVRLIHGRDRLKALAAELDRLARIDPLTGLSNRRDLDETLDAALSTTRRRGTPLSVLLIDVDHFKRINDTLGHEAGDAILVQIAGSLRASLRAEDSLGRWGGEEFLAVLPNTDSVEARVVADRLRVDVCTSVQANPDEAVTLTVGVAEFGSDTKSELVSRADRALYAGKDAGRDTVRTAPERRGGDVLAIR